jgi:hypothetical protein
MDPTATVAKADRHDGGCNGSVPRRRHDRVDGLVANMDAGESWPSDFNPMIGEDHGVL